MSGMTPAEVAPTKFEGMNIDLDDLPTNKQLQTDAKSEGVWIRLASVYLNYNDEELAAQVQGEDAAELFVTLIEDVKSVIDIHKNRVEMFEAFQVRLAATLARYKVVH
jgi:hypothetical protein